MKNLPIVLLVIAASLAGCGKKEEPATTVSQAAVEPAAPAEAPVAAKPAPAAKAPATIEESLTAEVEEVVETVKKSMPKVEEVAKIEEIAASKDISSLQTALTGLQPKKPAATKPVATVPVETKPVATVPVETKTVATAPVAPTPMAPVAPSAPEAPAPTLMDQATGAAMQLASSIDWANLSWDKVAEIPYDNKDELLAWAAPQIDTLQDQLTKYMMNQGTSALAGLGDTGWQGAIKGAVSALDSVKESSPETWEMARGGLIMAWDSLKSEAAKQMGGN